jgi:hypothetical protein
MARDDQHEAVTNCLRKRLRKIIVEHEQIARDIASWNANRTDAAPIDNGGDLVVADLARQLLALVEADRPIPDALWQRFHRQWRENARK